MQKEIMVEDVEKTLNEDDINGAIVVKRKNKTDVVIINIEEYRKIIETNLEERLKIGEEQIKKGEVTDADIVFANMRSKYGY